MFGANIFFFLSTIPRYFLWAVCPCYHEEIALFIQNMPNLFGHTEKLLSYMVLILDGNSEHVAHAWRKMGPFGGKNIRFVTARDLIKCLEYIKLPRLLLTCAPISWLPSNM